MEPRFRGGPVIFARSFARIHETNLKKQGLLPLTFADPATYDQIGEDDRISVLGLAQLAPDEPVHCQIHKPDGTSGRLRVHADLLARADRVVPRRLGAEHHPSPHGEMRRGSSLGMASSGPLSRCRDGARASFVRVALVTRWIGAGQLLPPSARGVRAPRAAGGRRSPP